MTFQVLVLWDYLHELMLRVRKAESAARVELQHTSKTAESTTVSGWGNQTRNHRGTRATLYIERGSFQIHIAAVARLYAAKLTMRKKADLYTPT
jgi:hypothetical protein